MVKRRKSQAKGRRAGKRGQNAPSVPVRALQMAGATPIPIGPDDDVRPILEFLANFQKMVDPNAQKASKLISLKVPEPLLAAFRFKCQQSGVAYQTMIKQLMIDWLKRPGASSPSS